MVDMTRIELAPTGVDAVEAAIYLHMPPSPGRNKNNPTLKSLGVILV